MLIRRLAWSAASLALAQGAFAVEWTPVLNGSISGGQYFFQRQRGNLAGNASVTAAGLGKLSPTWSVLPVYAGAYRGTKGVEDGVGAGTLFQQGMDHAVSVTGLKTLEDARWKLKPSAGYRREFLKETRDERWGRGLFDFEKISAGFEVEKTYKDPFAWRVAVDAYRVRFPNYESLESRSGVDPAGNPLGRELAPKRVLDTMNFSVTASGSRPWPFEDPKLVLQGAYTVLYKDFVDQRVVNAAGQFDPAGRADLFQSVSGSAGRPIPVRVFGEEGRLDLSLGGSFGYNRSNQNTYDASFAKFVDDAYSFWTVGMTPAATLSWGDKKRPSWLTGSLRWSRQQFLGRLAQEGSGAYTGKKQWQQRWVLALGYGHPLAENLTLTTRVSSLWATSNHNFNRNYAYDYRTINYLIGVNYEY